MKRIVVIAVDDGKVDEKTPLRATFVQAVVQAVIGRADVCMFSSANYLASALYAAEEARRGSALEGASESQVEFSGLLHRRREPLSREAPLLRVCLDGPVPGLVGNLAHGLVSFSSERDAMAALRASELLVLGAPSLSCYPIGVAVRHWFVESLAPAPSDSAVAIDQRFRLMLRQSWAEVAQVREMHPDDEAIEAPADADDVCLAGPMMQYWGRLLSIDAEGDSSRPPAPDVLE